MLYNYLLDVMDFEMLKEAQEKVDISLSCINYQLYGAFFNHSPLAIEEMKRTLNDLQDLWREINDKIYLKNDEFITEFWAEEREIADQKMEDNI